MTEASPDTIALQAAKSAGINILVIPQNGSPEGCAFVDDEGNRYINVFFRGRGHFRAQIIGHEIGHHVLGHTTTWTSLPAWQNELAAERFAIKMLSPLCSRDEIAAAEDRSRDYLRPMIQEFLDWGITNHGEVDAGIWAGCEIHDN